MRIEPLSKTSVEILVYLSPRLRESFTVRQIAKGIAQDYKITYVMAMRLARQRYIIAEKLRPVTYCRLNLKGNSALLAYIEGIRASRFLTKHREVAVIVEEVLNKMSSPFFTMIVFGSYVKGTASKRSDLDILLVVPEKKMDNDVSSAIATAARTSPIGIHDVILSSTEFAELLSQKTPNVAWEALDNRVVPHGAESLFTMLEDAI